MLGHSDLYRTDDSLSRKPSKKHHHYKLSQDKLTQYLVASKNEPNPEKPSVLVVGYPDGSPKGLHIFPGSKPPQVMSLGSELQNPSPTNKISKLIRDRILISDSLRLKNPERPSSAGGNRNGIEKQSSGLQQESPQKKSARSRKRKAFAESSRPSSPRDKPTSGESRIVAPWKELGPFQSAEQRRRRTFDTFKMMSFDPPPALTNTFPKSILQTKKSPEYYTQLLRISNFGPKSTWNHSKTFNNGPWSLPANQNDYHPVRPQSRGATQGKSFTGLSLKDPRLANSKVPKPRYAKSQGLITNMPRQPPNQKVTTILAKKPKPSLTTFKSTNPFQSSRRNISPSPARSRALHPSQSKQIPSHEIHSTTQKQYQDILLSSNTPAPSKTTARNTEPQTLLQTDHHQSPRQPDPLPVPGNETPSSSNDANPPPNPKTSSNSTWKRKNIYIGHYDASDSETELENKDAPSK